MKTLTAPDTVSWEITEKCNLQCIHCSNAVNGSKCELSITECYKILDILSQNHVFRLNIEGGEPFAREDLITILHYANNDNFRPKIDTNGTLIDTKTAEKLSNCNLRIVQVSLDGPTADSYARVRKSTNAYNEAINGICRLKANNVPVGISMVLMKDNIHCIDDFIALAEDLQVDSLRFVDYIPTGRGGTGLCASSEQLKKAYGDIIAYTKQDHHIPTIYPTKITGLFIHNGTNVSNGDSLSDEEQLICEAGTNLMHIRANGDVTPCVYFREREFVAGNILFDNFDKIWQDSFIMNSFRSLGKLPEICSTCYNVHNCKGGCRAYAYYRSHCSSLNCFDQRCWRRLDV